MTDSTRPVTVAELTERLGVRSGTLAGGRHRVASENTTVSRFVGSAVVGVALSGGLGLAFAPAAAAHNLFTLVTWPYCRAIRSTASRKGSATTIM